jgi:hypothetical protein
MGVRMKVKGLKRKMTIQRKSTHSMTLENAYMNIKKQM